MKIAVWLLDLELLHTVEVLQGESFPNLHTIRGTRYRDPELWFKGSTRFVLFLPGTWSRRTVARCPDETKLPRF